MSRPEWEDLADRLAALGRQVAAELDRREPEDGRGWSCTRQVNGYGSVSVHHPSGMRLHIWREKSHLRGAAGQRLTVQGTLPGGHGDRGEHRLTVAGDRPPEGIARDVARRLLPGYRVALEKAQRSVAQDAEWTRARRVVMARMRAALPAMEEGPREEAHSYGLFYEGKTQINRHRARGTGAVTLSRDGRTGRLDVSGVPVDLLVEFLAALDADPRPVAPARPGAQRGPRRARQEAAAPSGSAPAGTGAERRAAGRRVRGRGTPHRKHQA